MTRKPKRPVVLVQAEQLIDLARKKGCRQLKVGEFECVLGIGEDDTDAIGFEVPNEGEREYEPEETRRRKRKGRGAR